MSKLLRNSQYVKYVIQMSFRKVTYRQQINIFFHQHTKLQSQPVIYSIVYEQHMYKERYKKHDWAILRKKSIKRHASIEADLNCE